MKNNVWYLTKQRFSTLGFHTGRLITFGIFLAVFLACNLVSLAFLGNDNNKLLSNVMIIVASAVAGILMMSLGLSIFRGEVTSNQVNLELRQGYKPKQIYVARLIEIATYYAVFMIVGVIVNMIVVGVEGKLDDVVWYHMFVSSLGWYAIISLVGIGMAIFFSSFLNSGWSGTIVGCVVLALVLIGGFIAGIVAGTSAPYTDKDDYAGEILQKDIDSNVLDFAENQLGITSEEEWMQVEKSFLNVESTEGDYPKQIPNPNYHPFNNDPNNPDSNKPTIPNDGKEFGRQINKVVTSTYKYSDFDWQTYYSMISGDWSGGSEKENPLDRNAIIPTYSDGTIADLPDYDKDDMGGVTDKNSRIKVRTTKGEVVDHYENVNPLDPNTVAAFAAFGNRVLAQKDLLPKAMNDFFDQSHDFFTKNLSNIKYSGIMNWNKLNGKANVDKYHSVSSGYSETTYEKDGHTEYDIVVDKDDVTYINPIMDATDKSYEDYSKIMKSVSNSDLAKKYPFLKQLAEVSNANVLSTAFNEWTGGSNDYKDLSFGASNMDTNRKLYPQFAKGGNIVDEKNMQKEIEDLNSRAEMKVSPAEMIFNRNLIYFISKAFEDLNAYKVWTPGRTILGSIPFYDEDKHKLVFKVQNAYPFNYDGYTYEKTGLNYGALSKADLESFGFSMEVQKENSGNNNHGYNPDYPDGGGYDGNGDKPKTTTISPKLTGAEYVENYSVGGRYIKFSRYSQPYEGYGDESTSFALVFDVDPKAVKDIDFSKLNLVSYNFTSDNPKFMISNTADDMGSLISGKTKSNNDPGHDGGNPNDQDHSPAFTDSNPWIDYEESKPIVSNIKYDSKGMHLALWEKPSEDTDIEKDLDTLQFSDSKGKLNTNGWEEEVGQSGDPAGVVTTFNRKVEGQIQIGFKDPKDPKEPKEELVNLNLVDGSFFKPSFDYKDTLVHKTAISWIYNPLTQLQAMFNGVNYRETIMDNIMTSYINEFFIGINNSNIKVTAVPSSTNPNSLVMKTQRADYVEIVYVYYALLEFAFIFAAYWMYRKTIVS